MRVHAFCADNTFADVIIYDYRRSNMIDNFLWDVCNRHHSFALAVHDLLLETSMNVGAPVDYGEVNDMSFHQQYELETEFEMLSSAYEYDDQLIAMDKKSSKNFVDKQVRYHNLKPRFLEMKNMQQEFQVSSEQKFGHTRKSIEEKLKMPVKRQSHTMKNCEE